MEIPITNVQTTETRLLHLFLNLGHLDLDIMWNLVCLREAPPCGTKAGAWKLVIFFSLLPYSYFQEGL